MSDRPAGDEIDQELRRAMGDIAAVPDPAPELDDLFSPTLTLEGEQTMKINTRRILIAAAAAIIAVVVGVVLFAPSDESDLDTIDSPDGPTTTLPGQSESSDEVDAPGADISSPNLEVDTPDGEDDAVSDGTNPPGEEVDPPSPEDLIGVWRSTSFDQQQSWRITRNRIDINNGVVPFSTYSATDSTIELKDDGCGDVLGTYEWAIVDDILTLTVIEDECARSDSLSGATFERIPSALDLVGVWEATNLERQQVWTIVESGILIENGFVESQTYTATDSTIELVDSDCGVLVPGLYDWEIVGDVLTLTVVEDECARADTLDGAMLERVE